LTQETTPKYDVLLYVWGSEEDPSTAVVGIEGHIEGTVPITRNLETTLKHIRDEQEATQIWIDALCIDQNNLAERSEQVALMGRIYPTSISGKDFSRQMTSFLAVKFTLK
jgi:hypothetical protein